MKKPVFKKIGGWFMLIAGGVVLLGIICFTIWRVRLAQDLNVEFAAIHAAGLPTNGDEANAYYPDVPDAENAAVKMEDAFELLANYDDRRSNEVEAIKFPLPKPPLTAEQMELMNGYWEMNRAALAQANEAVKLPRSRYPLDLSLGAETLLPHLAKLKTLAHLADFSTYKDPGHSTDAISTILGLAHTLDKEPVLISKLVRFALVNEAVGVCERRLNSGEITTNELTNLGEMFEAVNGAGQIANGYVGERAMFVRHFRMSWADIKKFSADESASSSESMPSSKSQPLFLKLTGMFERDLRFYVHAMDTNIILAEHFPVNPMVISNVQAQIEQTSRKNYYLLSSMLLPALGSAIFREATEIAQVRMVQTALAIENFRLAKKRLPETFNELIPQYMSSVPEDPFVGQPLHYKIFEKGYVVYSVGKDGEDNGGRQRPVDAKSSDKSAYDITFTVER